MPNDYNDDMREYFDWWEGVDVLSEENFKKIVL